MAEIDLQTPWGLMPTYVSKPTGEGQWPGVVVIHDAFGASENLQRHPDWLPGDFAATVSPYFDRPYQVINAGEIAAGIFGSIRDAAILALPRAGAIDQFVDNTAVLTKPERARAIAEALFN